MADGSIVIDTRIDQSGANEGLKTLQGNLSKSGDRLKETGKTLTKFVTTPIIGAGIASAKFAMDQEAAFAKVSTLLTGSAADYQKYKEQIRQASSDMGVSFEEYSESVYGAISAGVEQGKAIQFTGDAVKLAKGGFTDTATAVDIMTTAINAYGMEADDAAMVSDMLINTQNMGKTTVDELAASMGAVIPVAKAQNVSFDQLSTGYAVLTKNGIATSEAGTYMKSMFGELGKAGSEVDKILREKTGKSFADLQAEGMNTGDVLQVLQEHADESGIKMGDMFGSIEAGSAAMVLAGDGGAEFQEILGTMGESAGATDDAFKKMSETTSEKMAKAFNEFKNTLATLGEVFLPVIVKVIKWVTNLMRKFTEMGPAGQKIIMVIAAIAAAIGPFLVLAGMVVSIAGSIAGVFAAAAAAGTTVGAIVAGLAAPFAIAIGIFAALIAVGVLLYKNWDTIKEYTIKVWNAIISFLQPAIDRIKNTLMERFELIRDWWYELQDNLKAAFENIWNAIVISAQTLMAAFQAIFGWALPWIQMLFMNVWDTILGVIDGAINVIMGAIGVFAALFTGNWKMLWANVLTVLEGFWGIIKSVFSGVWNHIGIIISAAVSAIVKVVSLFMQDMWARIVAEWEIIKTFFSVAWDGLKQMFSDAVDALKQYFADLGAGVVAILQPYIDFWSEVFTNVWESIKNVFQAAVDWIKNLIAVVLGSEIAQEFMLTFNHWKEKVLAGWEAIKLVFNTVVAAIGLIVTNWLAEQSAKITSGFEFVKAFISNVWNKISTVIGGFLTMIKTLVSNWIEEKKTAILNAMTVILGIFNWVWTAIRTAVANFLGGMKSDTEKSMNDSKEKVGGILTGIKNFFLNIWNSIVSIVKVAVNAIKTVIEIVFNGIKTFFSVVWEIIKGIVVSALMLLRGDTESALNRMKEIVVNVMNLIKNFFSTSWNAIRSLVSGIVEGIKNTVRDKFQALKNAVTDKMRAAKDSIKNIWNAVMDFFRGINLYDVGKNMIQGLINGVKNMAGSLVSAAKGVVGGAIDGAKNLLKIKSPSRVFMEIGEYTGEGMEVGLNKSASGVANAGKNMATAAIPNMKNLASTYLDKLAPAGLGKEFKPGRGNSTTNNSQNIVLNYNGSGSKDDALSMVDLIDYELGKRMTGASFRSGVR